jgi:Tfp pilus assembly protein PilO
MAFIQTYKKYLTRTAIVWAACLALFALAYIFVLGPQIDSIKRIENEITKKKQQYEMAQLAAREQTKAKLNEEIEGMRDILRDFVVDLEDSANLTFDIGQIANEEKVSSFSIKSKDKRGLLEIPDCNSICESHVDIDFVAGFSQFATFVNALERHRPVLFVHEFAIARSTRDGLAYQVSLDVAAFVKKQQNKEVADRSSVSTTGSKI